jgi:hypothetical protein
VGLSGPGCFGAGICEGDRRKGGTSIAEMAECEMRAICFCRASAGARVEFLYSRKARFHQRTNKTGHNRAAGCQNQALHQRQGEEEASQAMLTGDSPSTHPARETRVLRRHGGG